MATKSPFFQSAQVTDGNMNPKHLMMSVFYKWFIIWKEKSESFLQKEKKKISFLNWSACSSASPGICAHTMSLHSSSSNATALYKPCFTWLNLLYDYLENWSGTSMRCDTQVSQFHQKEHAAIKQNLPRHYAVTEKCKSSWLRTFSMTNTLISLSKCCQWLVLPLCA